MSLPVLNSSGDLGEADLVRLFYRTELQWGSHLGEAATLDAGTALANAAAPGVWDANTLHDAFVPPGMTVDQVAAQVEAHYASVGTRCAAWVLRPTGPAEQTEPLAAYLRAGGYRLFEADILHTNRPVELPTPPRPDLTIIPARASFRHLRQLLEEATAPLGTPGLAEAAMNHYDDPHYDALIALQDGRAIAHVGVLAMGEVGRIEDVYVSKPARRRGVGRLMVSRAMEICRRSLFRQIMLSCTPDNAAAQGLYAQFGMRRIGRFVAWRAPWTAA